MIEAALLCLALNVFFEAAGEPIDGQFAVAQVTLNRAQRNPEKVCDVVYAPAQFSWTAKRPAVPKDDNAAFQHAKRVAQLSLHMADFTGGADHYHATYVRPEWDYRKIVLTGQWGNHIFYKRRVGK
jgi:spore germination cell wall hydrolase CwlJ-like protein